jgi:uncharacterized YigZ family protein
MSSTQKFITLTSDNEFKFKEKGSLFIGQAFIIDSIETAETKLAEIKKKYYDATHNCYAYLVFKDQLKYSDDGEPNGTAGIRIYNAVQHFNMVNILLVVTRYYGGVKLGVGPLGKAYYNSAFNTLEKASKKEREVYHQVKIKYNYDMSKNVHHFLNECEVKKIKTNFRQIPEIECFILPEKINYLEQNLKTISKGKISFEITGTNFLI